MATGDLSRLKGQLLGSGLQTKDPTLFQVIDTLIGNLQKLNGTVSSSLASVSSSSAIVNSFNEKLTIPVEMNQFDNYYSDNPYPSPGTGTPIPIPVSVNITDDNATDATMYPVWVTAAGTVPLKISTTNLQWNPLISQFSILNPLDGATISSKLRLLNNWTDIVIFQLNSLSYTFVAADSPNKANGFSLTTNAINGISIGATNGSGVVSIFTGGSAAANERIRIINTGLVGIGTTPVATALDISNSLGYSLKWLRTGVSAKQWGISSDANGTYFNNVTDTVTALTFLNAGNVGIGTTAPLTRLDVRGPSGGPGSTGAASGGIFTVFASDTTESLAFGALTASPYSSWIQTHDPSVGYYPLALNPLGGNVGIGTTTPQNLFVVSNGGAAGIEFIPSVGGIFAYNRSTVAYAPISVNGSTVMLQIASVDKLGVNASGHVSIAATARLYLDGVTGAGNSYILESSADTISIFTNGALAMATSLLAFTAVGINNNTTASAANVNITAAGLLRLVTSSINIKKNIENVDINHATKVIKALRGVTYNSKVPLDGDGRFLGLIAEEVAEIDPLLAQFNDKGEPVGVNYGQISVYLASVVAQLLESENGISKDSHNYS